MKIQKMGYYPPLWLLWQDSIGVNGGVTNWGDEISVKNGGVWLISWVFNKSLKLLFCFVDFPSSNSKPSFVSSLMVNRNLGCLKLF